MNKVLKKFLIILLVILTLNNFFMQPVAQAAELGAFEEAVEVVINILGGLVGLLTLPERFLAIQAADQINNLSAGIAYIDNGTNKPETITPYEILFNKVKIVDINFFNIGSATGTQEGAIVNKIRLGVSGWFYAMRNISAAILLCILLYVGIRMAISTIASDRAMYKKMLVDWVCSLVLIFVLQYIMIFTIYCNNAIVNAISFTSDPNAIKAAYDKIAELAMEVFSVNSLAAVIVYCMLVWQTLGLFFSYLNRMIKIAFLIIISPLISITYSIDKIGDGKAQALGNWLKEFVFTVLIQPFHCAIYMCLISTSLNILVQNAGGGNDEETLAGAIIAILCIKFTKDAEKIVKKIFAFKSDDSKTSLAGGLAISAMALNNAKGLGKSAKGAVVGAKNFLNKSGGAARNVLVETAAAFTLLRNADGTGKSFTERKEEINAKIDNWQADKLEGWNEKYTTNKQKRMQAAMNRAGQNVAAGSKDAAAALDAAREKELEERTQQKITDSGNTMSHEAARAAARKELAKEEFVDSRKVTRNIKKAVGKVNQFKRKVGSSAVVKELGSIGKQKIANSLGLVAGAGLYGTKGDLASSIMAGAAISTSTSEFLKSSSNTLVNQSNELLDRLGLDSSEKINNTLDDIFSHPEKYDVNDKEAIKKLDDILKQLDGVMGKDAADSFRTKIKNKIKADPRNALDNVDDIFKTEAKNNPALASNDKFTDMHDAATEFAAKAALYATMSEGEALGMSRTAYKKQLIATIDSTGGVDKTHAVTSRDEDSADKVVASIMEEPSRDTDSYKDKVRNAAAETGGFGDRMQALHEKLTQEAKAQEIVAEALSASAQQADKDLAEELKKGAEELIKRRDDIIVEALTCGAGEVDKETKKLAKQYSAELLAKMKELEREATTQHGTRQIKANESLERLKVVASSINLSTDNSN